MIPDLGKYAADVLSAYGIALLLLAALIVVSLRQSAKARATLDQVEQDTTKERS